MLKKFLNVFSFFSTKQNDDTQDDANPQGFGTLNGVYIPSLLMMFGVILFLRLGLITAYIGPLKMGLIIVIGLTIMLITASSITSVVTNMRVGSGGVYYLLSRSLGIEFGGAIGFSLYVSQIISIALCTSGFAVAFCDVFPQFSIHAVEVITLLALTALSILSTDLALKAQFLIFILLSTAIASVFFGSYENIAVHSNTPFFPKGLPFWEAFSLFYPALTGIEAGMAMSGTLKNPSRSLSVGTFSSLITSAIVYFTLGLFLYYSISTDDLKSDPLILLQFGVYPKLIVLGIWGATLSSVLASLLGAPRMLQAIAQDGIVPEIFGRVYGKNKEPRYAIALTCCIAILLLLLTTMDQIIPILTMICLISYGSLNLVTGFAELINTSSWRPLIRTPWLLSFVGSTGCFILMFLINAAWTLIAICLVFGIYFLLRRRNIDVSFKDIRENIIFFFSRLALYKLSESEEDAHNWHPKVLVFIGSPKPNEKLIYFCDALTRRSGILTFATIIPPSMAPSEEALETRKSALEEYYAKKGINCLIEINSYESAEEGMENLIKSYGIGAFQPNTIVLPFDEECPLRSLEAAESNQRNVVIFQENDNYSNRVFTRRFKTGGKRIDIWWEDQPESSFELMLSLMNTLAEGVLWRGAKLHLQAVVKSQDAKEHVLDHLKQFLERSRLRIKPHIILIKETQNAHDALVRCSRDADLTFIAIPPVSHFDNERKFIQYYTRLTTKTMQLKAVNFVIANDQIDHSEIYEY